MKKAWVETPFRDLKERLISDSYEQVDDDLGFMIDLSERERILMDKLIQYKSLSKTTTTPAPAPVPKKATKPKRSNKSPRQKASPKKKAKE